MFKSDLFNPIPMNPISMCCSISAELCITFGDSTTCCDTVNIGYCCTDGHSLYTTLDATPSPANNEITLDYEFLPEILPTTSPLKIDIVDAYGNHKLNIYNAVPSALQNTIPVNISQFSTGIYFFVLDFEDEVETFPFLKQ